MVLQWTGYFTPYWLMMTKLIFTQEADVRYLMMKLKGEYKKMRL
jgi:hypothetical protein